MNDADKAANEAIARVRSRLTHEEMAEVCYKVFLVASEVASFTTDDVNFDLPEDVEPRVIGAVMRQAAAMGICEPSDSYRKSQQVTCHARPKRVWLSKVMEN